VIEQSTPGYFLHLHQGAQAGNDPVAGLVHDKRLLFSDGVHALKPIGKLIRLPAGHDEHVIDYHAVARDSYGRIYSPRNSRKRPPLIRALARSCYLYDEDSQRPAKRPSGALAEVNAIHGCDAAFHELSPLLA